MIFIAMIIITTIATITTITVTRGDDIGEALFSYVTK